MKRVIIEITEELDQQIVAYHEQRTLTYNLAIVDLLKSGLLALAPTTTTSDDWYGVCESCQ